jgi:hypothetical protein
MRRAPLLLLLTGLLATAFFVLTDPRLGMGVRLDGQTSSNVIDADHQALPGTLVGVSVASVISLLGLGLALRRGS